MIGAGLAGLASASALAERGHEVTIYEAGSAVGGRARGRHRDGFAIDPEIPLVSTSHRHLLGWIQERGLAESLLPLRPVQLAQMWRGNVASLDSRTLAGLARLGGVRFSDAWRLLRLPRLMGRYEPLLRFSQPELAADLDFRSAADFGRLYFGRSLYERWVAPTAAALFLDDPRALSRVAFLLAWMTEQSGDFGLPQRALHVLAEGAAAGLDVRLGTPVERVEEARGAGFRIVAGEGEQSYDAVVFATRAGTALEIGRALLVPAERDYLSSVVYGPSLHVSAALERPLTGIPVFVRVPPDEGSSFVAHLVEPGSAGGRAPTGCGLVTAAASREFCLESARSDDAVVEKTLRAELERAYPRATGNIRFTELTRVEEAIPSFRVGAYRALARFVRVQSDRRAHGRRVYFAGDYLVGPGAAARVASGKRAARELCDDLSENTRKATRE